MMVDVMMVQVMGYQVVHVMRDNVVDVMRHMVNMMRIMHDLIVDNLQGNHEQIMRTFNSQLQDSPLVC